MITTHKIALRPNKTQLTWIKQHAGYARYAYNSGLADFCLGLDEDKFYSKFDLRKRFNASKPQWADSSTMVLWTGLPARLHSQNAAKNALINLGRAIDNWLSKRSNFPTFKKKGISDSFGIDNGPDTIQTSGKKIKLPKMGWIAMFEELRFAGRILKVVISRTAQRWFASITVDTPIQDAKNQSNIVCGIDVGINTLATLSDGTTFCAPKPLKRHFRKLRRARKKLSRCNKGSSNRIKAREKLERIHARVANIREDAHHKATFKIIKNSKVIGIETLNVSGMMRNRRLARTLSDVSLGKFLSQLKYKAEQRDVVIIQADQWFASSKTCHACGSLKKDLTLSDRVYSCTNCGIECNRDLNAAINLEHVAVSSPETQNACREEIRLASARARLRCSIVD